MADHDDLLMVSVQRRLNVRNSYSVLDTYNYNKRIVEI